MGGAGATGVMGRYLRVFVGHAGTPPAAAAQPANHRLPAGRAVTAGGTSRAGEPPGRPSPPPPQPWHLACQSSRPSLAPAPRPPAPPWSWHLACQSSRPQPLTHPPLRSPGISRASPLGPGPSHTHPSTVLAPCSSAHREACSPHRHIPPWHGHAKPTAAGLYTSSVKRTLWNQTEVDSKPASSLSGLAKASASYPPWASALSRVTMTRAHIPPTPGLHRDVC